jgi:glycogen operon protein
MEQRDAPSPNGARVEVDPAKLDCLAGTSARLGAHWDGQGVNFAVCSEAAERLELCLFDGEGREVRRLALPEFSGGVWHGYVAGLAPGQRYGFRAHGPYAPERGLRFNPNKLLLDPYARALAGRFVLDDAVFGYTRGAGEQSLDPRDSAPFVPKSVIRAPAPVPPETAAHPRTPWPDTLVYEAHLKGLTRQWEAVEAPLRGTYDGLGHPAVVAHLVELGVTAVELLPIQGFLDEPFLTRRGLTNYWGYNPIAFFAPEARYLGPGGSAGLQQAVGRLHAAGIEVILDVVYNHTAEGDQLGPTLCFRGLDNAAYYKLQPDDPRRYIDDSGCGNTLDLTHPFVQRLAMDSLRHWVEVYGVDGFRFDLAPALGRGEGGFDPRAAFLAALRQDPVLAETKLIAEPWDLGAEGYRLGDFPPPFAEWNDRARDDLRRFWRGDASSAPGLAARLLGSAELFDRDGRRPWASVNLVTAHDGFTLADLVSYARRHNAANGEKGRDGHGDNFSDNCGAEGRSDDPAIRERRARRRRNLLATLFLSQGTPMLLAGDEIGNTQGGNNNAYCQDNPLAWLDWPHADEELLAFVRRLTAFRRAHPVLRQDLFLHGGARADGRPDTVWRGFDGTGPAWDDPHLKTLALQVRLAAETPAYAQGDDELLMAFNADTAAHALRLPEPPAGCRWRRVLDTAAPDLRTGRVSGRTEIAAESLAVFAPAPEAAIPNARPAAE